MGAVAVDHLVLTAAVPETSQLLMTLAGLPVIAGLALRRRKNAAV